VNDHVALKDRVVGHQLAEGRLELERAAVGRHVAAKLRQIELHEGVRHLPLLPLLVVKLLEAQLAVHLLILIRMKEARLLERADPDAVDGADRVVPGIGARLGRPGQRHRQVQLDRGCSPELCVHQVADEQRRQHHQSH